MPHASPTSTPVAVDEDVIEIRMAELDRYTCSFERHRADTDPAPLYRGLPDDRCQCTHLGYVTQGTLVFRYADREETIHAGESYVATPGHTPLMFAGTEVVEFTLSSELQQTLGVVGKNLEAMKAGA